VLAAAALALLAASAEDPDQDACLLQPAVYRYLARAQDRILAQWELPPDGMANREVVLRLVFAADGWPSDARLVSTSDRRLARSVELAILRAAPFGNVPPEAACLVGLPIRTTLRNPAGEG
jgi:TonB C terminal